jgi:hypothetical protein
MKIFALISLMSLSVLAFDPTIKVEYQVNDTLQTDVLFVIDNSGSMDSHQKLVAGLSDNFLRQFNNVSYKITAINTDTADSLRNLVIAHDSPDPIKELSQLMTSFGVHGDSTELVFTRVHDFFVSEIGQRFMRKNTPLEIIVVTDEEEQSTQTVEDMMNLLSVKKFTFNAFLPMSETKCIPVNHQKSKIEELVSLSGGLILDLCKSTVALANDYEKLAKAIVQRAGKKTLPITKFVFKEAIDINSVKVYYGTQIIQRGILGTGWVYDEVEHTLHLGQNIVLGNQPVGTKFTIQYDIL